jgi:hypothetical protein
MKNTDDIYDDNALKPYFLKHKAKAKNWPDDFDKVLGQAFKEFWGDIAKTGKDYNKLRPERM